jgi:ribosomal-protein-alanine N-acetyltransferase
VTGTPADAPAPITDPQRLTSLCGPFGTTRLWVAPPAEPQAAAMFGWLQDPQVYEWISTSPPADLATLASRLARWGTRCTWPERELYLAWSVQRRSDGAWIGSLDVSIRPDGRVAGNVGYVFGQPFWGGGLASEAVAGLCRHLDQHGVTEQLATVTLGNHASCRVLQRAGFVRSGLLAGNDTVRGVLVDDVAFVRHAGAGSAAPGLG